jgi:exonuclease III
LQVAAFMFGSVPLKTYLPDGDIDVSIFCQSKNIKDNWTTRLQEMLEAEQRNSKAQFKIGDIQVINAEVGPRADRRADRLRLRQATPLAQLGALLCLPAGQAAQVPH